MRIVWSKRIIQENHPPSYLHRHSVVSKTDHNNHNSLLSDLSRMVKTSCLLSVLTLNLDIPIMSQYFYGFFFISRFFPSVNITIHMATSQLLKISKIDIFFSNMYIYGLCRNIHYFPMIIIFCFSI